MTTPRAGSLASLLAAALLAACHAAHTGVSARSASAPSERPYVLVLGTAQDAGLPQIACTCAHCGAARAEPERRRYVSSILLVDPRTGARWLFDATPDLREQVELARGHGDGAKERPSPGGATSGRPPLFDGIFLTHAHMGHYTGLAHLGDEAYATRGTPAYGSARMAAFLAGNGPWDLLVERGRVVPTPLEPDRPLELAADLSVTAIPVPHRDEYTDTFAYVIRGPERALLFLPDIDKWERWERRVEDVVAGVDVALLDGAFHADGEIPGRAMEDIPHPFITETLARFAGEPTGERAKVRFIHLNHTNPATDPASAAAAEVRAAGMAVAREGDVYEL